MVDRDVIGKMEFSIDALKLDTHGRMKKTPSPR